MVKHCPYSYTERDGNGNAQKNTTTKEERVEEKKSEKKMVHEAASVVSSLKLCLG